MNKDFICYYAGCPKELITMVETLTKARSVTRPYIKLMVGNRKDNKSSVKLSLFLHDTFSHKATKHTEKIALWPSLFLPAVVFVYPCPLYCFAPLVMSACLNNSP